MGVKLTLRVASPVPIEVDGITPERVAGLSELEVAKLPVRHGRRAEPLGELFAVGSADHTDLYFAGVTRAVKGIGAGMTGGDVIVAGDAGMYAGAGMTGGRLTIAGDAGDWLGAEMSGGVIVVGHVGNQCGAAYRGSRRGMTGGTIHVGGHAGDELGLRMRRGLITVVGNTGAFTGAAMIAGTVLVAGRAGPRAGAGMRRGTIVAAEGVDGLPPSFAHACDYEPGFLALYREFLTPGFGGPVRCYRGDLLEGGRGEILIPNDEGA